MSRPGTPSGVRVTARQSFATYLASVAGNYVFLTLSFLVSVVLTRGLGVGGFGRLTLVIAVGQTAVLFAGFWTYAGLLRYGAEELAVAGTLRRVLWGRMLLAAPTVLLFVALGWAFRGEVQAFHGVETIGFPALTLYFLTLFVDHTLQAVYHARARAGAWSLLQAGERGIVLAVVLLGHLRGALSVEGVLAAYVAAGLGLAVAGAVLLDRRDLLPVETSRGTVRRVLLFSWPMLIGVLGSYFSSNWLDVAVIRHFLGAEAVGQYALAYQLMGAVQQVPTMSFPAVVPLLVGAYVRDRGTSVQLYLDRAVPHAVFAMSALLSLGVLLAPAVVTSVFGPAFAESARVLVVLLFAVGWYCVFIAYIPILNLRERSLRILGASLAAAAVNVAGDLVLIPLGGLSGAAWATVLAQATSALLVAAWARREYPTVLAPVVLMLGPLGLVTLGAAWWGSRGALAGALLAAGLLVIVARRQRLGSAADRRILASMDLPGLRRLLPLPADGEAR